MQRWCSLELRFDIFLSVEQILAPRDLLSQFHFDDQDHKGIALESSREMIMKDDVANLVDVAQRDVEERFQLYVQIDRHFADDMM